jgi:hypothetical protein
VVQVRIVHAATSARGGAGIAAQRICQAQVASGLRASIFFRGSRRAHADCTNLETIPVGHIDDFASRATTVANRMLTRQPSILFAPRSTNALAGVLGQRAHGGILNLHNSYNMISFQRIQEISGPRAIFLTLHDERALTAGCHATLGCTGPLRGCLDCPQSRFPRLIPATTSLSRQRQSLVDSKVHLIAPSRWLSGQAIKFGWPDDLIHHIPNPIDTDVFHLGLRETVSLPLNRHDPSSFTIAWLPGKDEEAFWNGYREFRAWLGCQPNAPSLQVLTTHDAALPSDVVSVRVSPPSTDAERAAFWAAADMAVSVTSADNFPNVVLEAIAVGTPICISRVGGAAEAVLETGGGYIIKSSSRDDIAAAMVRGYSDRPRRPVMMGRARDVLSRTYSYPRIGEQYSRAYSATINESRC